jgi:hypothetical protein
MDPKDSQFSRLDENNKRFINAIFKQGRTGSSSGVDPELMADAQSMRNEKHEHDYSDSKNNDTCSTCGSKNPNDSYNKGKD